MTVRRTSANDGFTLAEVLVALFLVGLGVLAAAPMFMAAMRGNAVGADLSGAGALAVERMELLRTLPFDQLVGGGSLDANFVGYSDTSHPDFVVRWEITGGAGPGTMKSIRVRSIAVRQSSAPAKQVTLSTLRAR